MPTQEIPYDEMRRLLGLSDVRDEVMAMRARAMAGSPWPGRPYVFHTAEYGTPRFQGAFAVHPGGRAPSWLPEMVRIAEKAPVPPIARWQLECVAEVFAPTRESLQALGEAAQRAAEAMTIAAMTYSLGATQTHWLSDEVWAAAVADESAPETLQQRALPRPSHTPPMWAPDPARTRRSRNGGIDMRTPRV